MTPNAQAQPQSQATPQAMAYEQNGQRISRSAFYAVACNPERAVVVEACAGAGKTWMLVSRMLRALLAQGDDLQPDAILAITFTKDAAAEMRERLHQWLAEFAGADDALLRQALQERGVIDQDASSPAYPLALKLSNLYQRLLATGRQVQIQTFHGWFASLLKVAPLAVLEQLQLPAPYELVEDDARAIALVWRRFFARLVHASADAQALKADYQALVAEHGISGAQKALRAGLDKRLEFARAQAAGVLEGSVKTFAQVFTEFAGLDAPDELLQTNRDHRQKLREAARLLIGKGSPTQAAKGQELAIALEQQNISAMLAALLTLKGEPRQFGKLKDDARIQAAQDLVLRVAGARAQHAAWLHQQRMVRLCRALALDYAQLKQERGWVDMSDLERAAVTLLADPVLSGWVQERLDARVKHLLIDEFQDTNPLQWQALFTWLQSYAGAGSQAPSVFIVGDPKQSIYRFRRAEPQVFEAAKHFVREGLGGDVLACDHTRRNARAVVGLVNAVMQAAQDAGELGHDSAAPPMFRSHTTESTQAGCCALLPIVARPAASAREVSLDWRDTLSQPRELAQERQSELEARQAAAYLAHAMASGQVQAGDVMVLARKRERLAAMQDALRSAGVASHYLEKASLYDAPEVRDMAALVQALVSPGNDLALAQALKSPAFGASDAALIGLAQLARSQRCHWLQALFALLQKSELVTQYLQGLEANFLYKAARSLRQYQRWLAQLPPHDALDAIYHHADVLACFSAAAPAPLRPSVQANLQALLASALAVDGGRFLSPHTWLRHLQSGAVPAQPVALPHAVQLLTIHGAKGLEAPWVLLLDTDAAPARAQSHSCLMDWPAEQEAPNRFVFLPSETRPPACCAALLQAERAARAREDINALYVALTRAKTQVIISAHEPHHSDPASAYQRLLTAHNTGAVALDAASVPLPDTHQATAASRTDAEPVFIRKLPIAPLLIAQAATQTIAYDDAKHAVPVDPDADISARIGQAMHRLLERAAQAELQSRRFGSASQRAVAREFLISPAQAGQAAHMAQTILSGQAAWAWDERVIDWAGNEVELIHQGQLLRMDRVVRRQDTQTWWVLDYKSSSNPQQQAQLTAQLKRYALALGEAQALGAPARCAFVTAAGECVVL